MHNIIKMRHYVIKVFFWAQNARFYWFSDSLPKVMVSFLYYTHVFEAFCSQHSVQQTKLRKAIPFFFSVSRRPTDPDFRIFQKKKKTNAEGDFQTIVTLI